MGLLDGLEPVRPDIHIHTSSAIMDIPASVPQVKRFYKMKEVWSPESIKRFKDAKKPKAKL
jgi:hypothetical protein